MRHRVMRPNPVLEPTRRSMVWLVVTRCAAPNASLDCMMRGQCSRVCLHRQHFRSSTAEYALTEALAPRKHRQSAAAPDSRGGVRPFVAETLPSLEGSM